MPQPCLDLSSRLFPRAKIRFRHGRKRGLSARNYVHANVPFPCTCRAEISSEELSNVTVISSSIGNGGNRVRNFPSVSIIIGDRIPSSSMNQERNRIGLKLKRLLRTPIILRVLLRIKINEKRLSDSQDPNLRIIGFTPILIDELTIGEPLPG